MNLNELQQPKKSLNKDQSATKSLNDFLDIKLPKDEETRKDCTNKASFTSPAW